MFEGLRGWGCRTTYSGDVVLLEVVRFRILWQYVLMIYDPSSSGKRKVSCIAFKKSVCGNHEETYGDEKSPRLVK